MAGLARPLCVTLQSEARSASGSSISNDLTRNVVKVLRIPQQLKQSQPSLPMMVGGGTGCVTIGARKG